MPLVNNSQVTLAAAIGGVLSTGVALAAIFIPGLTEAAQVALVAFGNSVILTGALIYQLRHSTSNTTPTLGSGTEVKVVTPAGERDFTTIV